MASQCDIRIGAPVSEGEVGHSESAGGDALKSSDRHELLSDPGSRCTDSLPPRKACEEYVVDAVPNFIKSASYLEKVPERFRKGPWSKAAHIWLALFTVALVWMFVMTPFEPLRYPRATPLWLKVRHGLPPLPARTHPPPPHTRARARE